MAPARPNRLPRWYPPAWRERYGEELLLYMQHSFGPGDPLVGGYYPHEPSARNAHRNLGQR